MSCTYQYIPRIKIVTQSVTDRYIFVPFDWAIGCGVIIVYLITSKFLLSWSWNPNVSRTFFGNPRVLRSYQYSYLQDSMILTALHQIDNLDKLLDLSCVVHHDNLKHDNLAEIHLRVNNCQFFLDHNNIKFYTFYNEISQIVFHFSKHKEKHNPKIPKARFKSSH